MHDSNEDSLFVPKYEPMDTFEEDVMSRATSSDEDEGDEFEVEAVLAERQDPDDPHATQYLIQWENYPMDQCTWEPLQNLGKGVLEGWEEAKAEIEGGKRAPFNVSIFEDAVRAARIIGDESLDRGLDSGATESASDGDDNGLFEHGPRQGLPPVPNESSSVDSHNQRLLDNQLSRAHEPSKASKQKTSKASATSQCQSPPGGPAVASVPRYQGTAAKVTGPQHRKASLTKLSTAKPSADLNRQKPSGSVTATTLDLPSSSLRDKFTGKKAIRSRRVSQIVMPGERERRPRQRLEDNMAEPSRDPKHFHSFRALNTARKRGIARQDTAPRNVTAIPAHFLISNDRDIVTATQPKTTAGEEHADISPKDSNVAPAAKRAKKAVRFTEVDGSRIDEGTTVESPQDMMNIDQPLPPGKKLSLSTYQARSRSNAITKSCSFGPGGSAEIQVIFDGVPVVTEPWVTTFSNAKGIAFDRECSIADFVAQRPTLVSMQSQVGAMRGALPDLDAQLANVAANLKQEGTALLFYRSQFAVLIFAPDAPAWLDNIGDMVPADEPRSDLMYLLFKPADAQLLPNTPLPAPQESSEQQLNLLKLFKEILCLDSCVLRPRDPAEKRDQVFMLCFSSENQLLCQFVALWLRTMQVGCRVYLYNQPGAWKSFEKDLKLLPGAVIFDEILTPRIRRFPKIWSMLDGAKCCTLWCLASGESINPPRFPSTRDSLLASSQYHFTALFPHGRCFLLTPSFVLSDPSGLCEFLEWFIDWGANPGYMLVTGHNFAVWMHSVIAEQIRHTEQGANYNTSELFTDKIIEDLEKQKQQLKDRARALVLWQALTEKYGDEQTSESLRHVTCAPQQLHSSDEQSLVNWFFWWSLQNLDRHRRFMVIGSQPRRQGQWSLEFRIPNYPEDMLADPDAEEIEAEKVIAAQRQAQLAAWKHVHPGAVAVKQSQDDLEPAPKEPLFSGHVLKSDHPDEIIRRFRDVNNELRGSFATVFDTPVVYSDMEMADYFHDPKGASATFKRWLYTGTSRPFGRKMNTWLGLFYTIDGCWNPSIPAQSQKRRPWAVVLRPVNAHDTRKPYTAMELLIWDSLAESDAADTPDLSCLIDMQARLVDFVKEEIAHGEVPDYYLSRVWLSNRLDRDMDTRGHPLEVACQQVELMARETRFWLPPYEVPLQARGWVQVSMSRSSSGRNKATLSRAELFNEPFPKCSADAALPEQIIFHPLRSQAAERRVANRKPSQCSNDMYKAALEARKKDRNCSTARLQYRPTMQWYADLKEEKRDASHVLVDTWEGISFRLRKAGQKSGQKTGSRPSSSG